MKKLLIVLVTTVIFAVGCGRPVYEDKHWHLDRSPHTGYCYEVIDYGYQLALSKVEDHWCE